jgi:hypothetical protein
MKREDLSRLTENRKMEKPPQLSEGKSESV